MNSLVPRWALLPGVYDRTQRVYSVSNLGLPKSGHFLPQLCVLSLRLAQAAFHPVHPAGELPHVVLVTCPLRERSFQLTERGKRQYPGWLSLGSDVCPVHSVPSSLQRVERPGTDSWPGFTKLNFREQGAFKSKVDWTWPLVGQGDTRPWERLKATQSRIPRSSQSRTLTTERAHTYSSRSTYQVIQSRSDREEWQPEGRT